MVIVYFRVYQEKRFNDPCSTTTEATFKVTKFKEKKG